MAASSCSRLARSVCQRSLLTPETLPSLRRRQRPPLPEQTAAFALLSQGRRYSAESVVKSPFDAHVLRILDSRIELESECPVFETPTKFDSYTVQDQPGQRWVTLRGKFGDGEDIKIEATSFDAAVLVQKPDSLEIRNVYLFRKEMQEKMHSWPYMGPDSRKLNAKIRNTFQ
ncbi:hypothetical protein NL676_035176 [Syzygium grande]|nr:hypothetical protein NL676_035176 [Syzygium grande]